MLQSAAKPEGVIIGVPPAVHGKGAPHMDSHVYYLKQGVSCSGLALVYHFQADITLA